MVGASEEKMSVSDDTKVRGSWGESRDLMTGAFIFEYCGFDWTASFRGPAPSPTLPSLQGDEVSGQRRLQEPGVRRVAGHLQR